MGCYHSVYICKGYKFVREDLIKKTPNPKYGIYKFDPDTGKEITKFIEDETLLNTLFDYDTIDINNSETNETISFFGLIKAIEENEYVTLDKMSYKFNPFQELKNQELFVFLKGNNIKVEEGTFTIHKYN
jgi:hypothetical protein